MIYVYAISEPIDAPLPRVAGLQDQPLSSRHFGGIHVVYTQHPQHRVALTPENLWRHESVVEAVMQDRATLPVRFGTTMPDEGKLDDLVGQRAVRLSENLDRVRGCVELGVRVLWKPHAEPHESPRVNDGPGAGHAYLLARLAEERRAHQRRAAAEQLAGEIDAALSPLARDRTRRVLPAPELPLVAAYLVPRERRDDFARTVEHVAKSHGELRLLCTGPWPPYHFVDAFAEPAATTVAEVRHG